jgi:hypothetical protein
MNKTASAKIEEGDFSVNNKWQKSAVTQNKRLKLTLFILNKKALINT